MIRFPSRALSLSLPTVLLAAATTAPGIASAQDGGIEDKFGISLRLGVEFETEPDAAIALQDFGSRVTWNDRYASGSGPDVLASIDLAYGLDQAVLTREAWLGLDGDFGTIKGGTQFRAFYDLSTSFTDIGWWDTCYVGIGCARTDGVLKYETELTPTVRVIASTTLTDRVFATEDDGVAVINPATGLPIRIGGGDAKNEFIDQLEAGAILDAGNIEIGAVLGIDLTGDTGFAVGTSARTSLNEDLNVGVSLQFASEDYVDLGATADGRDIFTPDFGENLILASLSANTDNVYGLVSIGDSADTLFGITAGYVLPLAGTSKVYAEVSGIDPGGEGSDFDFNARAVYVYHYGAPEAARRR